MNNWPDEPGYRSEDARPAAITRRLRILAAALAGLVIGMLARRHFNG